MPPCLQFGLRQSGTRHLIRTPDVSGVYSRESTACWVEPRTPPYLRRLVLEVVRSEFGEQWSCGRCAHWFLDRRAACVAGFHLTTGRGRSERMGQPASFINSVLVPLAALGVGADRHQPVVDSARSRANWSRTIFVPPRTTGPMNRPTTPNTMIPPKIPTVMTATLRAPLRLMIAGRR